MKLLVASDGSPSARRALAYAIQLAAQCPGSSLVLVNVQNRESLRMSELRAEEPLDREEGRVRSDQILAEEVAACKKAGVPVETRAEFGAVPETIVRLAQSVKADQIVMGTRGMGQIAGLFLGSTARDVVRLADIPVTLTKAG